MYYAIENTCHQFPNSNLILTLRSLRYFAFTAVLIFKMVLKAGAQGKNEISYLAHYIDNFYF